MSAVLYSTPPAPGTAKPSNLYADLQSRSLWLGVDPAVEPAGAVLISDIVALQAEIAASEAAANAYTDTKILTRAPVSHTHVASQITDFNAAVAAVVTTLPSVAWVPKMIMMWSGSLAELGVGAMVGWALCDGSNGTPDLRDKFILGAGHSVPGVTNPSAWVTTDVQGGHTHTISGHNLTVAQMPSHGHTFTGTAKYWETGAESATHTHTVPGNMPSGTGAVNTAGYNTAGFGPMSGNEQTYGQSVSHFHGVTVTPGGTNAAAGGGEAHSHGINTTGSHSHSITSLNLRNAIPYYAMAYIMKLP